MNRGTRRAGGVAAAALMVLLLAACAGPATPPPRGEPWAARQERLRSLTAWHLSGRIGLRTELESWTLGLDWHQQGDRYRIRLSAPLGQGSAVLSGDGESVTLLSSRDPRPLHAGDAEALLRQALGWDLPVSGLRYWVLGLPAGTGEAVLELDAAGRIRRLEEAGWEIDYRRYTRAGDLDLPAKLFLTRDGLEVRIVVQQWRIGGEAAGA